MEIFTSVVAKKKYLKPIILQMNIKDFVTQKNFGGNDNGFTDAPPS